MLHVSLELAKKWAYVQSSRNVGASCNTIMTEGTICAIVVDGVANVSKRHTMDEFFLLCNSAFSNRSKMELIRAGVL